MPSSPYHPKVDSALPRCEAKRPEWRVVTMSKSPNEPSRVMCIRCQHIWTTMNRRQAQQIMTLTEKARARAK